MMQRVTSTMLGLALCRHCFGPFPRLLQHSRLAVAAGAVFFSSTRRRSATVP
jgi:hypothetical protein